MTIPKVLRSTENANKVSLASQGIFVLGIIYIANQLGFDVTGNDVLGFVQGVTIMVSGIATMWGIIRKIKNRKLHG